MFKTDPITELAKALDLVTDDAAIAAHVSAELLVSGVERSIIEAAWERQGLGLEQVLRRAEEWAAATAAHYDVAAADELTKALLLAPTSPAPG